MKNYIRTCIFTLVPVISAAVLSAQIPSGNDSTGLPGDHFSLSGALELFQKAASPEAFEKSLNTEENNVNNLDLNEDGYIDYVRVIDQTSSNADLHAIVLQAVVSSTESQDIAVIAIEKNGHANALLQIIGDDDMYGSEIIIEPGSTNEESGLNENSEADKSRGGPSVAEETYNASAGNRLIVNVWLWPCVQYIYAPAYTRWISPWRWHSYPTGWHPWRPFAWQVWHPRRSFYYSRPFVVVHTHRVVRAHAVYRPLRVYSVSVRKRHAVTVNNYRINNKRTVIHSYNRKNGTSRTAVVTQGQGRAKQTTTVIKKRKRR